MSDMSPTAPAAATSDDGFDVIEDALNVLCVEANHNGSRVALGHTRGLTVYDLFASGNASLASLPDPAASNPSLADVPALAPVKALELQQRHFPRDLGTVGAGVGAAALLFESSICAVVGGGARPCAAPHRVLLFTDTTLQSTLSLAAPVARVALHNDRVVVLDEVRLSVMSFRGECLADFPAAGWCVAGPASLQGDALAASVAASVGAWAAQFQTTAADGPPPAVPAGPQHPLVRAPLAVAAHGARPDTAICACPAAAAGSVLVMSWLQPAHEPRLIPAHVGVVDALALSASGELLATASRTATLVRVWSAATGERLHELRLATAPIAVPVRGLAFSPSPPEYLAAVDARADLKFFFVGPAAHDAEELEAEGDHARNQSSLFPSLQAVSSYFKSEWHCARVSLAAPDTAAQQPAAEAAPEAPPAALWFEAPLVLQRYRSPTPAMTPQDASIAGSSSALGTPLSVVCVTPETVGVRAVFHPRRDAAAPEVEQRVYLD